jgi:hypothetical protein
MALSQPPILPGRILRTVDTLCLSVNIISQSNWEYLFDFPEGPISLTVSQRLATANCSKIRGPCGMGMESVREMTPRLTVRLT